MTFIKYLKLDVRGGKLAYNLFIGRGDGRNRVLDKKNVVGPQKLGVNVYLNGHFLKLQSDYFYIFGDDTGDGTHAARVQLDASF